MNEEARKQETSKEFYERPTQNWICGWAAEGRRCHLGPLPNGHCTVTSECTPLKQGNGWVCTRWPDFGGECEQGPLPDGSCCRPIPRCQPVRSLRSKRTVVTRWAMSLTLGVLLVGYGGFWQEPFISTGDLSAQHSTAVGECADCHVISANAAQDEHLDTPLAEDSMNDRCIVCHDMGPNSLGPHGIAPEELSAVSQRSLANVSESRTPIMLSLAALMPGGASGHQGSLACASCHKEHRGREAEPTEFADLKCQSCHTNQFASFSVGHPDFSQYPYYRRTRLIFDHARHNTTHYSKTKKAFVCSDCHMVDGAGQQMALQPFESACLDCHGFEETRAVNKIFHHGQQILSKEVEFFALPRLDLRTLRSKNVDVGRWPSSAKSRQLTPFIELFLAADPAVAPVLERLKGKKLSNLRKASDDELQDVRRLAWAIKELLRAFANDDVTPLGGRLELIAGGSLTQDQLAALSGQAQPSLFADAIETWFLTSEESESEYDITEFENDLRAFRTQLCLVESTACPVSSDIKKSTTVKSGGSGVTTGVWTRENKRASILYQLSGHGDDFLKAWLDFALQLQGSDSQAQDVNREAIRQSGEALFAELGGVKAKPGESKGAGQCLKCHSIESAAGAPSGVIDWTAFQPQIATRGFSTFAHAPHLQLGDKKAWVICHVLEEVADSEAARSKVLESFVHTQVYTFTGNFSPMTKDTCSACHNPKTAGDPCVTCHNYHIGALVPTMQWTATSSEAPEDNAPNDP